MTKKEDKSPEMVTVAGTKIEPLREDNYFTWEIRAFAILVQEGHWRYVNPDEMLNQYYEEDHNKALACLTLMISTEVLQKHMPITVAPNLWRALKSDAIAIAAEKQSLELQKLNAQQLGEKEELSDYFKKITDIVTRIRGSGGTVSNVEITGAILRGLPKTYDTAKVLCNTKRNDIEFVKTTLLSVEIQNKEDEITKKTVEKALQTRGGGQPSGRGNYQDNGRGRGRGAFRGRGRGRGGRYTYDSRNNNNNGGGYNGYNTGCYNCGKQGHLARDCPDNDESDNERKEDKSSSNNNKNGNYQKKGRKEKTYMVGHGVGQPEWILDSASAEHISGCEESFETWIEIKPYKVEVADYGEAEVIGIGTVRLQVGPDQDLILKNVRYAPSFRNNQLISVGRITRSGAQVIFGKYGAELVDDGVLIATGHYDPRVKMFALDEYRESAFVAKEAPEHKKTRKISLDEWHKSFGHINHEYLKKTEEVVDGMAITDTKISHCTHCGTGKATRQPMYIKPRKLEPLEEVAIDFWGPSPIKSLTGNSWYVSLTCAACKYREVIFSNDRKSVIKRIWEILTQWEKQSGYKVKTLRCDNARELILGEMKPEAVRRGILIKGTTTYTPEQNPVAERGNRFIGEGFTTMLDESHLPFEFFEEAAKAFVYVSNRCYYPKLGMTPIEALFGRRPKVSHLRPFGRLAVVTEPKARRDNKIQTPGWQGVFVGYGGAGPRVYNPETRKIVESVHTKIYPNMYGIDLLEERTTRAGRSLLRERTMSTPPESIHSDYEEDEEFSDFESDLVPTPSEGSVIDEDDEERGEDALNQRTRPPRGHYRPPSVEDSEDESDFEHVGPDLDGESDDESFEEIPRQQPRERVYVNIDGQEIPEPETLEEAMNGPHKKEWLEAIRKELRYMRTKHVYDRARRPRRGHVISCRWTFKIKPDGRFRARLVARGFSQTYGVNYLETYAPVISITSIHLILALAARHGLHLHQMDVITAFLYGELDEPEDVYMEQPPGFEEGEDIVWLLRRTIYGLKQSSRVWFQLFADFLLSKGFIQLKCDPSVFVKFNEEGDLIMLMGVYVDDLIIGAKDLREMLSWKKDLHERFEMRDMGVLKEVIGMQVVRFGDGSIFIHQRRYIEHILRKFKMENCKPAPTPLAPGILASDFDKPADVSNYQNITGHLNWPSLGTRPDISFPSSWLGRANGNPTTSHATAQKRVMRYLKGTVTHGILYDSQKRDRLTGFADADWGGDLVDRKSTSGQVWTLSGGAVNWSSTKQTAVAGSSVESEIYAGNLCLKEGLWLTSWLAQLGFENTRPFHMMMDSQGAIRLSENERISKHTKHIDIKEMMLKDHIDKGDVVVGYTPSANNIADLFTKPLSKPRFEELRSMIGMMSLEEAIEKHGRIVNVEEVED